MTASAAASAAGAAECAVAMQQRFDVRNRGADEQLIIRIGISMGDATHEGDDYFGMPAIEAARLCDKAGSAGILVPELVKMMIGRRGEHSFKPVGGLELKGIPEPVEAYEVLWEPVGAETGVDMPLPGRLMGTPPLSYVGRVEERELLENMWEKAAGGERQVGLRGGRARHRQDEAGHPRRALEARRGRQRALRPLRGGPRHALRPVDRGAEPLRRARSRRGSEGARRHPRRRADPARARPAHEDPRDPGAQDDGPRDRAVRPLQRDRRPARDGERAAAAWCCCSTTSTGPTSRRWRC